MAIIMHWDADRHPNYITLRGYKDALVQSKPTPHTGRHLWQFGKAYDWADTLEDAKEMVEGLAIVEGQS